MNGPHTPHPDHVIVAPRPRLPSTLQCPFDESSFNSSIPEHASRDAEFFIPVRKIKGGEPRSRTAPRDTCGTSPKHSVIANELRSQHGAGSGQYDACDESGVQDAEDAGCQCERGDDVLRLNVEELTLALGRN